MKTYTLKITNIETWKKIKIRQAELGYTNINEAIFEILERGLK